MDTKTLVVGQYVYMVSGCYWNTGKVVALWSNGAIDVQTPHGVLRFTSDGKGCGMGTYECGPWELDDTPFVGREALLEQAAAKDEVRKK